MPSPRAAPLIPLAVATLVISSCALLDATGDEDDLRQPPLDCSDVDSIPMFNFDVVFTTNSCNRGNSIELDFSCGIDRSSETTIVSFEAPVSGDYSICIVSDVAQRFVVAHGACDPLPLGDCLDQQDCLVANLIAGPTHIYWEPNIEGECGSLRVDISVLTAEDT